MGTTNGITTVCQTVWMHIKEKPELTAIVTRRKPVERQQQMLFLSAALLGGIAYSHPDLPRSQPKNLGPTRAISRREYGHLVAAAVNELRRLGIQKDDRVALIGEPSDEWAILNRAVQCMGAVLVPLYPRESRKGITYAIEKSKPKLLITATRELEALLVDTNAIKHSFRQLLVGDVFSNIPDFRQGDLEGELVFDDEVNATFEALQRDFTTGNLPFELGDLATIIFTSGSSGRSKGVRVTHRNIAASCKMMSPPFKLTAGDLVLHFMTGAHVLAKVNGLETAEYCGSRSAFSSPDKKELREAFRIFRPSVILAVPIVYDGLREAVLYKAGMFKSAMARYAIRCKSPISAGATPWMEKPQKWLSDAIIAQIKHKAGLDRLRIALTGAAPFDPRTLEFFTMLEIPIYEGYGSSETLGGIIVNVPGANRSGTLGRAAPGLDYKLVPHSEFTYRDANGTTGLLLVRGDNIADGYLDNEVPFLDADGYHSTGDILHIDNDGYFTFVSRASGFKKMRNGLFYPEDLLISRLKKCPIVAWAVPVGEQRKFVTALIYLKPEETARLVGAVPAEISAEAFYQSNSLVSAAIATAVQEANEGLSDQQKIQRYKIKAGEPVLTPTAKLQVNLTIEACTAELDALYAEAERLRNK